MRASLPLGGYPGVTFGTKRTPVCLRHCGNSSAYRDGTGRRTSSVVGAATDHPVARRWDMDAQANDAGDLVVIAGALESSSAADARGVLHAAVDRGDGDLVVDLRDVDHIDA